MNIRIGDKLISQNSPTFIIAEIGINHNGNIEIAKKLIDEAINSDPILPPQHTTVDNYSGVITSPIHISESNVGGYVIVVDDVELNHSFNLIDNDPQLVTDKKEVMEDDLEEN
jgi:hypothetical protein